MQFQEKRFTPPTNLAQSFPQFRFSLLPTSRTPTVKHPRHPSVARHTLLCSNPAPPVKHTELAAVQIQSGVCSPLNSRQLYAILTPVSLHPLPENLMNESKTNLYRVKLDVVLRTVAATDRPGRRFQAQRKPPRHIAICRAAERGSFPISSQPFLKSWLGHAPFHFGSRPKVHFYSPDKSIPHLRAVCSSCSSSFWAFMRF